jgi:hypothetical protein
MIQRTLQVNSHLVKSATSCSVQVLEHNWGEFQDKQRTDHAPFDIILGSDVAYQKGLYDPLISSLLHFSNEQTIALIGVTMADTTPEFFHKLTRAGFEYRRLADHLMEPEFRGTMFGIFMIQRHESCYRNLV